MNIFITGASRGIGRAIAGCLAIDDLNRKHHFFITAHSRIELLRETAGQLREMGHTVTHRLMDIGNREQVFETIESMKNESDEVFYIDVLINNAGIVRDRTFKKMSHEEWDSVINVNINGIYNVTKAVLPYMVAGGSIVTLTSVRGLTGAFGQTNYSATKSAAIGFTKSLAKELARDHIRVNAVACGFVNTDMTAGIPEKVKEQILTQIPLHRFAMPNEIGEFIKWLINYGTYCTGQVYVIDGGLT